MTGFISTPLSEIKPLLIKENSSVQDNFLQVKTNNPVLAVLNGEVLLRKDWETKVSSSDVLNFVILPTGGGGGRKTLQIVALIAVAAISFGYGGVLGAAILGGKVTATAVALGSSIITLTGSFLVNALLPPKLPNAPNNPSFSQSPTYSLQAQGNTARILQTIPRLYGTHIIYPDLATKPYISYENNDQYLYQLLSLGLGEYDVQEIRIEETKLWDKTNGFSPSFSDVEIEIIPPGEPVTLFPSGVISADTVSGQDILGYNLRTAVHFKEGNKIIWLNETLHDVDGNKDINKDLQNFENLISVGDTISVQVAFPYYSIPAHPELNQFSEIIEMTVTEVFIGLPSQLNYIRVDYELPDLDETTIPSLPDLPQAVIKSIDNTVGPFVASSAGTDTRELQLDFLFPQGLYEVNGDTGALENHTVEYQVRYQQINDSGIVIYTQTSIEEITAKDATPIRITKKYQTVLGGRYQVSVRRLSHSSNWNLVVNSMQWVGLKAFLKDDFIFPSITALAIKIKATSQLSQIGASSFNVIQQAKLPSYNGSTWLAKAPTNNPAWAIADILRNSVYGAGLNDSRIDLVTLKQLADKWAARGDEFNGVFDSKKSLLEALGDVCRVGRTQPLIIAGIVSFYRDEENEINRALLTPRNIIQGSLSVDYVLNSDDSPDSVIVEFLDKRRWKMNEVFCSLGNTTRPARIQIFGVTDRTQAWREGMYQVASNLYRRIFATCDTEMEGRMLLRGDSVMIAHDLAQWGNPAEIIDWNPDTRRITVNEVVSGTHCVISDSTGGVYGPLLRASLAADGLSFTLQSGSYNSVVASQGPIPINLDFNKEPTRVSLGTSTNYVKKFKVVGAKPKGIEKVTLDLVVDDERVYSADSGSPPSETSASGLNSIFTKPPITGLNVMQDPDYFTNNRVQLQVSWNPSPGAVSYRVEVSDGEDIQNPIWYTVYEGEINYFSFYVKVGLFQLRASAKNVSTGPYSYLYNLNFDKPTGAPLPITGLNATLETVASWIKTSWEASIKATSYIVSIYTLDQNEEYTILKLQQTLNQTISYFFSEDILSSGGPWESFQVSVEAQNQSGVSNPVSVVVENLIISPPTDLQFLGSYDGREINLSWNRPPLASSFLVEIISSNGVTVLSSIVGTNYYVTANAGRFVTRTMTANVRSLTNSLESTIASITFTDVAPPVPSNINTSSPAPGTVFISWTPVSLPDFKDYLLYASYSSDVAQTAQNLVYTGTASGRIVTGLTSNQTIYFRLIARDDFINGEFNVSSAIGQFVS